MHPVNWDRRGGAATPLCRVRRVRRLQPVRRCTMSRDDSEPCGVLLATTQPHRDDGDLQRGVEPMLLVLRTLVAQAAPKVRQVASIRSGSSNDETPT